MNKWYRTPHNLWLENALTNRLPTSSLRGGIASQVTITRRFAPKRLPSSDRCGKRVDCSSHRPRVSRIKDSLQLTICDPKTTKEKASQQPAFADASHHKSRHNHMQICSEADYKHAFGKVQTISSSHPPCAYHPARLQNWNYAIVMFRLPLFTRMHTHIESFHGAVYRHHMRSTSEGIFFFVLILEILSRFE